MEARLLLLDAPSLASAAGRFGLPSSVPGVLLAYLGQRGDWVGRDSLQALCWPEASTGDAQHNLRVALHRARQWLQQASADALLDSERRRVRFRVACDVADFRAACGRGDWAAALALRHAPLLSGLSVPGLPAVEEWLCNERSALDDAWRNAALRQAKTLGQAGQAAAAVRLLQDALQAELLAEDLVQELLRLARPAGVRDLALHLFERFRRRLRDELGAEPLPVTFALATALRLDTPAAPRRAGVAWPVSLMAPPLVGRDAERERLRGVRGRIVLVRGEPGVGKSRLVEAVHPDAVWLACRETWRPMALAPLADFIDDMQASLEGQPSFEAQRRELSRLLPRLWPGEVLPPLSSSDDRGPLLAALVALLESLQRPIVVDDLQWADEMTLELVRQLRPRPGVKLVCTARGNEIGPALAAWIAALELGAEIEVIELAALPGAAMQALVARLSGQAQGAPLFAAWLHRRSGGNPLFALETLRALFDAGRLTEAADGWASDLDAVTQDYSELQVAPQLAGLIQRRVDALGDAAGRVLAAAAVAGDARHLALLAAVTDLSPRVVAEAVSAAQIAGLLRGRLFAHDLVRQALVDAIPEAVRALLHAGLAGHGGELLSAHALAQHWWACGETARAIDASVRAAARDCDLGLHAQGANLLAEALARVDDPALRARVQVELARTAVEQGALDTARVHANAALAELPTPPVRVEALVQLGQVAWMQGSLTEARQRLAAACEVDATLPSVLGLAARLAYHEGAYDEAFTMLEQRCAQLRRQPAGVELVSTLTSMGAACDSKGEIAQGLAFHREAWTLAQRLGARYAQVDLACNLVWSLPELGLHDEAVAIATEALALGEYDGTPTLRNNLAWLLFDRGRIDEARGLYEQLAHGADPSLRCFAWAKLIEIAVRQGDAQACAVASHSALAAIADTDLYQAHAAVMAAVLEHGSDADARRALTYRRDQPLDAFIQERLDRAIAQRSVALADSTQG